jgi:hypothetical protein
MSKKDRSRPTGALGRVALDPIVQQELTRQEHASKLRSMTPAQRRKAEADAQRTKATYDLPAELIAAITKIAKTQNISKSDLVTEFLIRAVNDYRSGTLVLDNSKEPSNTLRWSWKLKLTDLVPV